MGNLDEAIREAEATLNDIRPDGPWHLHRLERQQTGGWKATITNGRQWLSTTAATASDVLTKTWLDDVIHQVEGE